MACYVPSDLSVSPLSTSFYCLNSLTHFFPYLFIRSRKSFHNFYYKKATWTERCWLSLKLLIRLSFRLVTSTFLLRSNAKMLNKWIDDMAKKAFYIKCKRKLSGFIHTVLWERARNREKVEWKKKKTKQNFGKSSERSCSCVELWKRRGMIIRRCGKWEQQRQDHLELKMILWLN